MHTRNTARRMSNDNFNDGSMNEYSDVPKAQLFEGLIVKSRSLLTMTEREAELLDERNLGGFKALQQDKRMVTENYAAACDAFHARIEEYRGISPALLDRLESLQTQIGEAARKNKEAVSSLMQVHRENTASTLLSAQEIGQSSKGDYHG